ncbi:hypothetical protein [Herbiconiux sp. A18JL235]|uniref:DUF4190 domain-containing protein n=1 Tax=Herbiconiux sp. A18JL235 TaxID=3152363 RepID=A0AB39BDX3_9MICO
MSKPELTTPAAGVDYPGKTLGIVGLILAIVANLIGLIVSAIAYNQSKNAGYKNTPAFVGIIVGAILLALGIIFAIIGVVAGIAAVDMSTTSY